MLNVRLAIPLVSCLVIPGCYAPVYRTYWVGEDTPEYERDRAICLEEIEQHLEALKTERAEGYISPDDCMRDKGWTQAREKKWEPVY